MIQYGSRHAGDRLEVQPKERLICVTLIVYFAYVEVSLTLVMLISGTTCYYLVQ